MTGNDAIRIGVLFSQSGPMAVTEHAHLQGVLLACEEINQSGAINGRKLDPVILDPAGSDERYAELATELLVKHRVNFIFGCCLSTSRKVVLPHVERHNGILFYPSVYEGFEYSPNVIYGGAVPNQVVLPLLEYIYRTRGNRIALIGSDTLFAREINRIVREFLQESDGKVVVEQYFPFADQPAQFTPLLRSLANENVSAIISTVVGESSVAFYNALEAAGIKGEDLPIASFTTTEAELIKVSPTGRAGHLLVAPYFGSLDTTANQSFLAAFKKRYGAETPSVYSQVCYTQVQMFAEAVRAGGGVETEDVLSALSGAVFKSPGGDLFLDTDTNHFTMRPLIGRARESGSFDVAWRCDTVIRPDPYLVGYDRSLKGHLVE
ncbi:MAG TPA: transporter substrate-binding domain-containing protein [Magnetospirillaceae bacterium]|jgi:branched-chain amino acid transport system substrate-binding protein